MEKVLPVLAIVYAALAVGIGVRIVNRRERWTKRTAAALFAAPVVYVLSFGPACNLTWSGYLPTNGTLRFYRPVLRFAYDAYGYWPVRRYAEFWDLSLMYLLIQNDALDNADWIDSASSSDNPPTPTPWEMFEPN